MSGRDSWLICFWLFCNVYSIRHSVCILPPKVTSWPCLAETTGCLASGCFLTNILSAIVCVPCLLVSLVAHVWQRQLVALLLVVLQRIYYAILCTLPPGVSSWQCLAERDGCFASDCFVTIYTVRNGRHRWPSWMRVRLETRRSRFRPQPRSATFFRGDWSWNIFYGHSLLSTDSRRAVVTFWRKNVHNTS